MSSRSPSTSTTDACDVGGPSDRTVRRTVAGYTGVLAAAATVTATTVSSAVELVGATVVAFAVGAGVGWGLSRLVPDLPLRLGRTRGRRAVPFLPALPFGLVALTSIGGRTDDVGVAALASAIAVLFAGFVLSDIMQTWSTDAMIDDEPIATYRWQPPQSPVLDRLALGSWLLLAGMDAYAGNWFGALSWAGLGLFWLVGGLADGRFRLGALGATPEVRIYEDGLVKQRPTVRSFVSWDEVDYVYLREGELVLDRGLFDVRFDRDELEGITLEEVLVTIKKRLAPDGRVP